MREMYFDVWAGDDLLGTSIGELTDASDRRITVVDNGMGSGQFTINRHSSQYDWVTPGPLTPEPLIRVRRVTGGPFDYDDDRYVFAFFVEEGNDDLLSPDEEGGEDATRSGRGVEAILARAIIDFEAHYADDIVNHPYDKTALSDGQWHFDEADPQAFLNVGTPGAVLRIFLRNAGAQVPEPIPEVTHTFSVNHDSNSDPWNDGNAVWAFDVGTDLLEVLGELVRSKLYYHMSPALVLDAFVTQQGTNLSGSIAFTQGSKAGDGISEASDRTIHASVAKSRLLVEGAAASGTRTYRWVADAGIEAAIGVRQGHLDYPRSPTNAILDKAGTKALTDLKTQHDGPPTLGVDEMAGQEALIDYAPGDTVTVDIPGVYDTEAARIFSVSLIETETGEVDVVLEFAGEAWSGVGSGPSGDCKCPPGLLLCRDPAATCVGGSYDLTPSQHFSPLGSPGTSDADGYVYYGTGSPANAPNPGVASAWGFPSCGGPGGPDFAGDCTNSGLYFVLVGAGTLTVDTAFHSGSRGMRCTVYHWTASAFSTEDTFLVTPGDTVVVPLTSDGSDDCVHTVMFSDGGGACGGKWGWSGADWVVDSGSPIVGGPGATAGDGLNAAPCNHDHAYTADQITYGSGTVADALDAGAGGSTVVVEDEGTPLTTSATTLNFTGSGVTASGSGATKTINIPGGGGGSAMPWFNVEDYGAIHDGTTDDTTSIQDAIDACMAAGGGTVFFPNGIYAIKGALQSTSTYNSQLTIPQNVYAGGSNGPIAIALVGMGPAGQWNHGTSGPWDPGLSGAILLSDWAGTITDIPSVIAAGRYDAQYPAASFNWVEVTFRNIEVRTPANPKLSGIQMAAAASLTCENVTVSTDIDSASMALPSNTNATGVHCPLVVNVNPPGIAYNLVVDGFYTGITIEELFHGINVAVYHCVRGIEAHGPQNHGANIDRLVVVACKYGIAFTGGLFQLTVAYYLSERKSAGTFTFVTDIYDPSNFAYGFIRHANQIYGSTVGVDLDVTGGSHLSTHWPVGGLWKLYEAIEMPQIGTNPGVGDDPASGFYLFADETTDHPTAHLANGAVYDLTAGGAPTTADYLVGTANGSLSGEIVVGTTPGGELGGTWASPTVDATHAGSTHIALSSATPLVESGSGSAGSGTAASKNDHVHPAAPGGSHELLIASTHSTPIVFGDVILNSAGTDFVYSS